MSAAGTTAPDPRLEAARELLRRGRATPEIEAYVQQAGQAGGGLQNPASFIRPDQPVQPGFQGTPFRFQPQINPQAPMRAQPQQGDPRLQQAFEVSQQEQQAQQIAAQAPPMRGQVDFNPTQPGSLPSAAGGRDFTMDLGSGLQSTPTVAAPTPSGLNLTDTQFVEQISQEYALRGQQITPEEAVGIARDRATRGDFQDRRPISVQAQEASARLQAREQGQDPYGGDVNGVLRDQLTVEMFNQGRNEAELGARADQLGLVGTSFLGFMNALTGGGTQAVAAAFDPTDPQLQGFTAAAQRRQLDLAGQGQVNVLPGAGATDVGEAAPYIAGGAQVASEFAGMVPSVGAAAVGGARLGRAATQGLQRVRPGALPTAGQRLGQGAGVAAGGFVAGEAAQAPLAAGMASAAGADLGEAVQQGVDFATTYPRLTGKIAAGEQLTQQDITDLLLLIPEAIAVAPDIASVVRDVRTGNVHRDLPADQQQALLQRLEDEIDATDVSPAAAEAAGEAMRPPQTDIEPAPTTRPQPMQPRTVQPPRAEPDAAPTQPEAYRGEFQDLAAGVPIRAGERAVPDQGAARTGELEPAAPEDVAAQRQQREPQIEATEGRELMRRPQAIRAVNRLRRENRQLSNEARTDPKTGLNNPRGYREAGEAIFQRADARGEGSAVIAFDMTNLKALNDFRGHDVADSALEAVGRAIESSLRLRPDRTRGRTEADLDAAGIVGRVGGDEFNVTLKNVTPEQADMIRQRIEASVDEALSELGVGQIDVGAGEMRTVRLVGGVAHRAPGGESFDAINTRADEAAIAAKEQFKRERGESAARLSPEEVQQRVAEQRADAEQQRLFDDDRPEQPARAAPAPQRAVDRFKSELEAGEDPPLTFRAMYDRYGVGYSTARKAFTQLIDEGVVEKQGSRHRLVERTVQDADEANQRRVPEQQRDEAVQPRGEPEQRRDDADDPDAGREPVDEPPEPGVRGERRDPVDEPAQGQPRDEPDEGPVQQEVETTAQRVRRRYGRDQPRELNAETFMRAYDDANAEQRGDGSLFRGVSTRNLESLRESSRIRSKPKYGKAIREELERRAGKSAGGPTDLVGSPDQPRGLPRTRDEAEAIGRAMRDPMGPHQIIGSLNEQLGIGPVGVGRSAALRMASVAGFIRVPTEAIRLRMADMLETNIHEVGHYLHKLIFQGGVADASVRTDRRGRRVAVSPGGLREAALPDELATELEFLGRALYGDRQPTAGYRSEGWAELVRHTFTDPSVAETLAPNSYRYLLDTLSRNYPREYAALREFQARYQLYNQQSPVGKLHGYIRRRANRSRSDLGMFGRVMTALFDSTYPLTVMMRDLGLKPEGEGAVRADLNPKRAAMRASGQANGDFRRAVRYGRFDPNNPTKRVGKSMAEVLAPVKRHLHEFEVYAAAKRGIERREAGNEGVFAGISMQELNDAVREIEEAIPEMRGVYNEFQEFNQWLIRDYAVAKGLLTPELAEAIIAKNLNYITFRKIEDVGDPDAAGGAGRGRTPYASGASGVRRFAQFQGQAIDPPLASFMASMETIMQRAAMNDVAKTLTDLFYADPRRAGEVARGEEAAGGVAGLGRWIDKVDLPMTAFRARGQEIEAQLRARMRQAGFDGDESAELLQALSLLLEDDFNFFRPTTRTDEAAKTFVYLRDGKPEMFQAKSTALFDFLQGVYSPQALGFVERVLTLPRAVYRAGATTLNPAFFVFNVLRDAVQSLILSEGGGVFGLSSNASARLRGMRQAFTSKDPVSEMFLASGASLSGLFGEYVSPRTGQFNPDAVFGKTNVMARNFDRGEVLPAMWEAVKLPFTAIANLNDRMEMMNRLGEFEVQLRRDEVNSIRRRLNLSETDEVTRDMIEQFRGEYDLPQLQRAGQLAADITLDFQRGGTVSKSLNQYVPFFNASMQGGYRLARALRDNPGTVLGRTISAVVMPSIVLMEMNSDNESYWNIPLEQRDRFWFIPLGDPDDDNVSEFVRLPKPYGLGAFALAAERAYASALGRDPVSGGRGGDPQAFRGMGKAIADQFRPPYYVPVLLPAMELAVNHSIYQGRPVVFDHEMVGDPEDWGRERSSHFSVVMSGLMQDAFGEANTLSPPEIDYLINGLFAGLGTQGVDYVADPLLALATDIDERPRKRPPMTQMETWPIVNRFLTEEPRSYTESLIRFYDHWGKAERKYRGFTRKRNLGADDAEAYFLDNQADIIAYYRMRPYRNAMRNLWQQLRYETSREGVSAEERWSRTSDLYRQLNDFAAQAVDSLEPVDAGDAQ